MATYHSTVGNKRINRTAALLISAGGCVLTLLLIGVLLWVASNILLSTIIPIYFDNSGGWSRAAQAAPFPIYQPAKLPGDSGTARVRVLPPQDVEDAGHVVEASYQSGLQVSELFEPSGDPLPPGSTTQAATIAGADSAYFYLDTVDAPTRKLLVRKGATAITL